MEILQGHMPHMPYKAKLRSEPPSSATHARALDKPATSYIGRGADNDGSHCGFSNFSRNCEADAEVQITSGAAADRVRLHERVTVHNGTGGCASAGS